MNENAQNYELAFHLNPKLEEPQALEFKQHIEEFITQAGGIVSFSSVPLKTRLSYTVKHQKNSFFTYIQFSLAAPDGIGQINSQLKLEPEILRHLFVKLPSEAEKKQEALRQMKIREKAGKKIPVKTAPAPENKEIDKQLEEIIGNL
ncbi:MAG: hypothetical protein A2746_01870 [Candidatus Yanofskybacteria bacterium RIFCSPHIGHO2_01_FULL_44_22]|uniref:Small ribosomal subunit protein bS6 n=1 Tax=Candidatus Yanofskybacteria bacterium RIFCSPHIGHO2_01_FULL_44_22 TaxID=1802669 RepID=A0A1F8EV71_9BACT|nr:MAG: hypothetical protein A2746_01870 [Candidatus Yanofskybacteria bacterium RIFCSPHIGHO2_01_FULL_44_22]